MEIHELLKFFRQQLNFTQKEVLPELDPSVYSRIENGKQDLKLTDLITIMDTLSLTPEEIFLNAPLDKEQHNYKTLFYYCSRNINNPNTKQILINYYKTLSAKHKNLRELSNYLAIKCYFAQFWKEIDTLSPEELNDTYCLLLNKNYYQHYDYVIILNIIRFFDKKQTDRIMSKIFRFRKRNKGVTSSSILFQHIILNVLTVRIHEKDYRGARKYANLGKKQAKTQQNFDFQANLKYLENLLDYITTGDYNYMKRIQGYISLLKDSGYTTYAEQLEVEVEMVIHNILGKTSKSNFPISLIKI